MQAFDKQVEMANRLGWIARDNQLRILYPSNMGIEKELLVEFSTLTTSDLDYSRARKYDYQKPLNRTVTHRNVYDRVFDQGLESTCMSHAIAWMLQARGILIGYPQLNLSPLHFHYCSLKLGSSNGVNQFRALHEIIHFGFPIYTEFMERWSNSSFCITHPTSKKLIPRAHHIVATAIDLKHELSIYGPVVANVYINPDVFLNYGGGVYAEENSNTIKAPHALCLIGYDDEMGAWEVMNSVGPAWGIQGRGYIKYGHCSIVTNPNNPLISFDLM